MTPRNRRKARRRANRVRRERAAAAGMPAVRDRYEKEMTSRARLAVVLLAASAAIVTVVAAILS